MLDSTAISVIKCVYDTNCRRHVPRVPPPSPYDAMENKLSQWIGRALLLLFLLSLTAVLAFSCWNHLSFRAILSGLLRPDWSEVVSITSYRTHDGVYTEYTADNGREQAERMLESVDLGLLPSLRGNSIDRICAGCTVVELTMAASAAGSRSMAAPPAVSWARGSGPSPTAARPCRSCWRRTWNGRSAPSSW